MFFCAADPLMRASAFFSPSLRRPIIGASCRFVKPRHQQIGPEDPNFNGVLLWQLAAGAVVGAPFACRGF